MLSGSTYGLLEGGNKMNKFNLSIMNKIPSNQMLSTERFQNH